MEKLQLPDDFKEFLKLFNSRRIRYLLIGGYAVGHYGYVRGTADIDFWVGQDEKNAKKIVGVLTEFGFGVEELKPELFTRDDQVVRMGVPPYRIEILTTLSAVKFAPCYARRKKAVLDGIRVSMISRADLLINKKASGRPKDLIDLDMLSDG